MKKIQFTSGCPNNCDYCYEPVEMHYFDPVIPIHESFQILDMNLLANPNAKEIIQRCGENKHPKELVCGIDYRRLSLEIAKSLKNSNFKPIRWAWDYGITQQKIHKKVKDIFLKAGYKKEDLWVFILVNWKTSMQECIMKLDLLKVWNIRVADCCFDGGYAKARPIFWTIEQIKAFRKMCRKHNQLIDFGIDPELKGINTIWDWDVRCPKGQTKLEEI